MDEKRVIKIAKKLWIKLPGWLWLIVSAISDVIVLFLVQCRSQVFLLVIFMSTGFGYIWYQKSSWKWWEIWSIVILTGSIGLYIEHSHDNINVNQNLIFIVFLFLTFSMFIPGLFKICAYVPDFLVKKSEEGRLNKVKNDFNAYIVQYKWDGFMCRDLFWFYNKDGRFDTVKNYFFTSKKYELNNYKLYMLLKQSLYGFTLLELKDMLVYLEFVIEKRTFSSMFEKIKFFVPLIVPITTLIVNVKNIFVKYEISINILLICIYISIIIFSVLVGYYISLVRLKKDTVTAKMMKHVIERILEDKINL